MPDDLNTEIINDVNSIYPDVPVKENDDLMLIPRKNISSPALVIELKYDKDTKQHECQIERWQKN